MQTLKDNFPSCKQNPSGRANIDEIFSIPELQSNPLIRRVINIFDKHQDRTVDLNDIVLSLSALYGEDEEAKIRFAFQIYDLNNDGQISNGELFQLLKLMVGNNLTDVQLQQLVDRTFQTVDNDLDGLISYVEFKKMVETLDIGAKLQLANYGPSSPTK